MQTDPTSILVAGDDPKLCALIREQLCNCGFKCSTARGTQRAKELLDTRPFDLLIADVSMSGVSGLDLLTYAKRLALPCNVVLISGVNRRAVLARALMLGAYEYIERPFEMGHLVEVVAKAAAGGCAMPRLPGRAASAMQRSAQMRQASLESVRALVRAVEMKDPYTRQHGEQVTHYAVHLGQAIQVPDGTIESLRIASLLHDVGKIGVPDHILTKPGALAAEEFEQVRQHPALGADILGNLSLFARESRLVRHHHERWDGKGYPDGLTGEEIPLVSRIIQTADCMDAMLMTRTYKRSYPVEKMLDELVRCAGTQFDPEIASVAVQWCRANPDKLVWPGKRLAEISGGAGLVE